MRQPIGRAPAASKDGLPRAIEKKEHHSARSCTLLMRVFARGLTAAVRDESQQRQLPRPWIRTAACSGRFN
eukprot:CAMPEP_0197919718 /NCGR_PEP_ID=MMETSP1439-20131203/87678_1 /TAXON_ID=66791 /ORGANISM="Gonyaulax spinifera, Strain CCMP409" /LENGTH=70 /DNA_ID=CAMNT_0043541889 /DNA_START=12 /DNA_END=221 /DNA_ORIENTATION=+